MAIIDIDTLSSEVSNKNLSSSFLPVRSKNNNVNWDAVSGRVMARLLECAVPKKYTLSDFEDECQSLFQQTLDKPEFWDVLKKAYFDSEHLLNLAPQCLLFHVANKKTNSADDRVGELLTSFLEGTDPYEVKGLSLNFIEQKMVGLLKDQLTTYELVLSTSPYLPFLAILFEKDVRFLASCPRYLMDVLPSFLETYTFLYVAQLSLNLLEWTEGTPKPKPLYFILDTERASAERTKLTTNGWKSFHSSIENLFPVLSMVETLQSKLDSKEPLWKIAELVKDNATGDDLNVLIDYALRFREERGLYKVPQRDPSDAISALEWLVDLSRYQFDQKYADPKSTRYQANQKVVSGVEDNFASRFFQSRGRAGRVLTISQDDLLLLTNIAIGNEDRMRFHNLLTQFEKRGVYFDKQSQLELINLYERIGNVERMSDSGDALYVRKTI